MTPPSPHRVRKKVSKIRRSGSAKTRLSAEHRRLARQIRALMGSGMGVGLEGLDVGERRLLGLHRSKYFTRTWYSPLWPKPADRVLLWR